MRKILFFAVCLLLLAGCKEEPKAPVVTVVDNQAEVDSLKAIIDQRDTELNEVMATFNEIQDGLRLISEHENHMSSLAKEGEGSDKAAKIRADIKFIQDKMATNRKLIDQLRQQLNESSLKGDELKKPIDLLVSQLEEKDARLSELARQLESKDIRITEMGEAISVLNNDVADLKNESQQKSETISDQDRQLNMAYYVYGTKNELKSQGFTDKKGNVLKGDYNKNYLTKIDIRTQKVIKLYSKDAKILTPHPQSSYRLEADASKQLTLRIIDEKAFWHASKILIMQVK